jgi:hypothetical protein
MLSMAEISATYVTKSSKCLASTCYIKLVPKDLLYEITFFPLFYVFNQSRRDNMRETNNAFEFLNLVTMWNVSILYKKE